MDNDTMFEFDKFIDDIVVKEEVKRVRDADELTPQREYARRYRERPQNRVRYGR